MRKPFLNTMFAGYLKVFVSTMLSLYLAMGISLFDLDVESVKAIISAAVGATLPVIINALNKQDPRYGFKKETEIVPKDE